MIQEVEHKYIIRDIHNIPCYTMPIEKGQQAIVYHKELISTFHEESQRITVPLYSPEPGMPGYVQEIFGFAQKSFSTGQVIIFTVREDGPFMSYFGCALIMKHSEETESRIKNMDLKSIKGKQFRKR